MNPIEKFFKTIWWRGKSLGAMLYFGSPHTKFKIIGVTGTNGKTTTATLLYKIATELGYKAGLVSTVENIVAGKVSGATHTTPDAISLYRLFRQMADAGCEYVFMEVSSHAIDQNRTLGLNFAGGIFTNLTHDHLDYHKNLENYFLAKKKFFDRLDSHAFALANTDDTHGRVMIGESKATKFHYGFEGKHEDVEFHGDVVEMNSMGLNLKFNNIDIRSKLLGKFNAYNLLTVWSACSLLNWNMQKVNKIIENLEPPRGRFEQFTAPNGALIIIDFAHTPDALEKILNAVNEIKPKDNKLIAVFGCGGDRDPMKRKVMGKLGATLADIPIFTSDNPRSEDPDKIIEAMKAGLSRELLDKIKSIPNRHEAIKESLKLAERGDIILCAGKGHEDYQEIMGVKSHFYDREEFEKLF